MVIKRAEQYHDVLKFIPPIPEPPFEDEESLVKYWNRNWGANSEVGTLRSILLHRPGVEMHTIDESKWNEEAGALIGDNGSWYWRDRKGPNLELMQKQHDHFADVLRNEGVEVVYLDEVSPDRPKSVFTRDLGIAVPGGVILGRFAPATFEGGNFAYINNKYAAIGLSSRSNEEGIRQVRETLAVMGIEVLSVPLTGYALHLDGAFSMVDVDIALVNVTKLPYWFLEKLKELGIKTVDVHPDDNWYAINCVPVKPGKVIMTTGSDRTVERLSKVGVEVIQIEYDEILKNGGGPRCSSMPLIRDRL
jgi:N-dimethylarginine dimethylaminohydrolase